MTKLNALTASMLIAALGLTACNDDNETVVQSNNPEVNDQHQLISGTVTDADGKPVVGADVKVGKQSILTNSSGNYSLSLNNKVSNVVVLVRKAGYLTMAREVKIVSKRAHRLDITLTPDQITSAFSTNAGLNNLQVSGAQVSIPANSIVTKDGSNYAGTVNIAANYYNPDSIEGAQSFAQPFAGQNEDGSQQTNLITVGVIDVKLTDPATGAELNLKEGTQATLVYPEASTNQNLPTIPLWYYDEEKTIWVKDGVANRQADGSYKGQVSHFTLWNLDIPLNDYYALLEGCVIDGKTKKPYVDSGFANIKGRGNISNFGGTGNDGKFSIRVPFNTPLILSSDSYLVRFNTIQIPALAQNASYQINNGKCIEVDAIDNSNGEIDLNNNSRGSAFDELPLAPIAVTPVPSIPDVPFVPPTEQNTAGLIGYSFSFDTDSGTATGLENITIGTLSTKSSNSLNLVEKSLYVDQPFEGVEVEDQLLLTTQGISPQFRFSRAADNALNIEELNTTFTNNRYTQRLSNGFVSTGTFKDVSLAGQKIGSVFALENNDDAYDDIPTSVINKLNNLPNSLSTFSNGASCKKALTGGVNVDHIELNYKLPGLSFDQAIAGFGNGRRGTWAGIPWIAAVRDINDDEDASLNAFVNYNNQVYAASFIEAKLGELKTSEKNECALYNEVAKNQILAALRAAYPTL